MILGLTGGIASGKSTVSRMLAERGAALVDCDVLARAALERGQAAHHQVVEVFGRDLVLPDGEIDRGRLGAIVFADADARRKLEEIVHPAVLRMAREQIGAFQAAGRSVIILDAPLLIEAGLLDWVDKVAVVYVDERAQMERLMARNCLERDEARRRIASQMPLSAKAKLADYLIDNSGDLDATRAQVDKVWEDILNHAETYRIDRT